MPRTSANCSLSHLRLLHFGPLSFATRSLSTSATRSLSDQISHFVIWAASPIPLHLWTSLFRDQISLRSDLPLPHLGRISDPTTPSNLVKLWRREGPILSSVGRHWVETAATLKPVHSIRKLKLSK